MLVAGSQRSIPCVTAVDQRIVFIAEAQVHRQLPADLPAIAQIKRELRFRVFIS